MLMLREPRPGALSTKPWLVGVVAYALASMILTTLVVLGSEVPPLTWGFGPILAALTAVVGSGSSRKQP